MKKKIYTIDQLEKIILSKKKAGLKIVMCHGVFDLLHFGHINHFNSSKKAGDILIISVTSDKHVKKGPNRPYFNETIRTKSLASLEIVDYVFVSNSHTAINSINKIKPDFYSKGKDYSDNSNDVTGNIRYEKQAIKQVGGKIFITDDELLSSSNLLNKFSPILSSEQKLYLNGIKKKFNFDKIKNEIEKLSELKVLILGETIIDKYVFCEALGKSGKESVLSFKEYKSEKYLGGSLAIARHLSSFCKNISVISFLGKDLEEHNFIKKNLEKNIKTHFIKKSESKTIVKTRIIDQIDNRKIIGLYSVDDKPINTDEETSFKNKINKEIAKNDLIIIADYGHGIFTKKIVDFISKLKKFRSLNAQINSTNMGFHNIRKYKNVDSLVINASELRHEMRVRDGDLNELGKDLKRDIKSKNLSITMGRAGVMMLSNNKNIICPAFGLDTIDKVGAGDSLLAILSACMYAKIDENLSLLIASLAAAQSVKNIGNSKKVSKVELVKTLLHLIK